MTNDTYDTFSCLEKKTGNNLALSEIFIIFAAYYKTQPMTKETDTARKYLNINVLPPSIGESEDEDYSCAPINFYIIRLVCQLLDMADEDYTILTPIDKETLRDLLRYGSAEKVAKLQHKTASLIRMRANKAVDTLIRQVKVWQEPHHMLVGLNQRVHELEKTLESQNVRLTTLTRKNKELEDENRRLQQLLISRGYRVNIEPVAPQEPSGLTLVEEPMKRLLKSSLEDINIPDSTIVKLNIHNIHSVYDLVRCDEKHVYHLKGMGYKDLSNISSALTNTGLHLGTDVRWIDALEEFYIKK